MKIDFNELINNARQTAHSQEVQRTKMKLKAIEDNRTFNQIEEYIATKANEQSDLVAATTRLIRKRDREIDASVEGIKQQTARTKGKIRTDTIV